jgi:uncharacterized protein YcfJ
MKRITLNVLALTITATFGMSIATAQDYRNDNRNENNRRSDIAQVIRVERINNGYGAYERQECWNEQSRNYDNGYYRDNDGRLYRGDNANNKSGAVIGAIVGGALGNQAGKGDGRKAATVAGVVIGATIGNKIQRDNNQYEYRDDTSGTVRRCRTVYDDNNNSGYGNYDSYDVTYRYAGQTYHATTNYRPGRTIRVAVNVRLEENNQRYGNR